MLYLQDEAKSLASTQRTSIRSDGLPPTTCRSVNHGVMFHLNLMTCNFVGAYAVPATASTSAVD